MNDLPNAESSEERLQRGFLESVKFHQELSAEYGLKSPYSNYNRRTVEDCYERFGLSPNETKRELAKLRLEDYVRYSENVLPGLELTELGEELLEELSAARDREEEFKQELVEAGQRMREEFQALQPSVEELAIGLEIEKDWETEYVLTLEVRNGSLGEYEVLLQHWTKPEGPERYLVTTRFERDAHRWPSRVRRTRFFRGSLYAMAGHIKGDSLEVIFKPQYDHAEQGDSAIRDWVSIANWEALKKEFREQR